MVQGAEWAAWQAAIRQLYREKGHPAARDLAARSGLSHSTCHRVIRAEYLPSLRVALAIVAALGGDSRRFEQLWTAAVSTRKPVRYSPIRSEAAVAILTRLEMIDARLARIEAAVDADPEEAS